MSNYYVKNLETGKLELHFDKADYLALSEAQKTEIKHSFLWGRNSGCWISRAKEPNLYFAKKVAEGLGLEDAGKSGERLSFAEQMEQKQERAQRRADRYENRARAAEDRGRALQEPIERMHGDLAFFTQPNVNSGSGHSFTRQRDRMFASFERGFDEFRKSEYWKERAKAAREIAEGSKLNDKGFVKRRIEDRESSIRKLVNRVTEYDGYASALERGEAPRDHYGWEVKLSLEQVNNQIEADLERIEVLLDELGYYQGVLDSLGGVGWNKENLTAGDLVRISRYREPVRYLRGGPKNFTYEFTLSHMVLADGTPIQGKAAYAEIVEKVG